MCISREVSLCCAIRALYSLIVEIVFKLELRGKGEVKVGRAFC